MNAEQLEINNRTIFRQIKNTLYTLRCKLSEAQQAPDEYAQCYVNELQQAIINLDAIKKYF
jgi:cob(I)alamin adenosyltransferase